MSFLSKIRRFIEGSDKIVDRAKGDVETIQILRSNMDHLQYLKQDVALKLLYRRRNLDEAYKLLKGSTVSKDPQDVLVAVDIALSEIDYTLTSMEWAIRKLNGE